MPSRFIEVITGALVLGLAIFVLIYGLRNRSNSGASGYELRAEFQDASGIRAGTTVEIAGVPIGRVTSVSLRDDFYADVRMRIDTDVSIPEESELAWRQADLIGSPSLTVIVLDSASDPLPPGGVFANVDPADNFFELLSSLASQSAGDE